MRQVIKGPGGEITTPDKACETLALKGMARLPF